MFSLMNIIHTSSNVLLRMCQGRTQLFILYSLFILLFPALTTNLMLNAFVGVCIAQCMASLVVPAHVVSTVACL